MLCVYKHNETFFNSLGLAKLNRAYDVQVTKEINALWTLTFKMPLDDPKNEHLKARCIIKCEDQLYRIVGRDGDDGQSKHLTVQCEHIFFADARNVFHPKIPAVEVLTAQTGTQILKLIFGGSGIEVLDDDPVNKSTKKTDFFQQSKVNASDLALKVPGWIDEGELDINNRIVRFVKKLGRTLDIPLKKNLNLKNVKINKDDRIINRLYAFGPDDLPLPTAEAPKGYIDSLESQALYGISIGYMQFDDIFIDVYAPHKLLEKARWQFTESNLDRIDLPKVGYDLDVVELHKLYGQNFKFNLGDSLPFVDPVSGVVERLRVTKYTYYPYSSKSGTVTIGKAPKTYGDRIKEGMVANRKISGSVDTAGQIKHTALAAQCVGSNNIKAGAIAPISIDVDELSDIVPNLGIVTDGIITGDISIEIKGVNKLGKYVIMQADEGVAGIVFLDGAGDEKGRIDFDTSTQTAMFDAKGGLKLVTADAVETMASREWVAENFTHI